MTWPRACGVAMVLVALTGAVAQAQISPGPLARPHAGLEGALKCVSCHVGGREQMSTQCLQCHREIARLLADDRGYHARQRGQSCAGCHPDHAGRDFSLISWPGGGRDRFDHATAGWPLAGRHQTTACSDCHKPAFQTDSTVGLAPTGGTPTWVGLSRRCTTCHTDAHRRALGNDCQRCHDEARWRPAPRFDHDRSNYPLTGKHKDVACAGCHRVRIEAASRDTAWTFKPLAHEDCAACHRDPHHGRFAGSCRGCHVTAGFAVFERGTFDHNRTKFPLRGRHAAVRCADCHDRPGLSGRNPPFATCGACHADAHGGAATLAGVPADCDACHTEAGFDVTTFTVVRHRLTKYPLEGRHQQVSCLGCHRKDAPGVAPAQLGSARIVMRPAFTRCRDCHGDDHGGQLAASPSAGECSACHVVTGWTPSTFTVATHGALRFSLDGRHAAIACAACHGPDRPGLPPIPASVTVGKAGVWLHLDASQCVSCHVDPHQHRLPDCLACHTTSAFRPSTVDVVAHGHFAFPLQGAHRAVPCVACHTDLGRTGAASSLIATRGSGSTATVSFTTAGGGRRCESCHTSPHGGQFATRPDSGRCDACHDLAGFRPASAFDHDRDTKFPLGRGHAAVPCQRCHPIVTGPGGSRMVRYRPVESRCEACHQGKRT